MKSSLVALLFLLAATSAFADLQKEIVDCSNTGDMMQISDCAAALADREEQRMGKEFSRSVEVLQRVEDYVATSSSRPQLVTSLRRAQVAWEKYKSAECQLADDLAMGSGRGLDVPACQALLNEERANRLQALRSEYEQMGY